MLGKLFGDVIIYVVVCGVGFVGDIEIGLIELWIEWVLVYCCG